MGAKSPAGGSLTRIDWPYSHFLCTRDDDTLSAYGTETYLPHQHGNSPPSIIHSEAPYSPHPIFYCQITDTIRFTATLTPAETLILTFIPTMSYFHYHYRSNGRGLLVINCPGMLPRSLSAIPKMAVHSLDVSNFQLAKSSADSLYASHSMITLSPRIAAVYFKAF